MSTEEDRDHSVWSRPPDPSEPDLVVIPPQRAQDSAATRPPPGSTPIARPGATHTGLVTGRTASAGSATDQTTGSGPARAGLAGLLTRAEPKALGEFPTGTGGPVTGTGTPAAGRRLRLGWFLGAAGVLVAAGLAVVIGLAATGTFGGHRALSVNPGGKPTGGPPLAQACPPPTATAAPNPNQGPPPPPGPRTVDQQAGISYQQYGQPWNPWIQDWVAGQLKVHYRTGQGFVTELYPRGQYWASILSGTVPATVNDGNILDLKCVGQQIVADVRGAYYPQPNTMDRIENKQTTLGGLNAWVSVFRLHFHQEGLKADNELVGVVTIDVGKPTAAVLYVSIPGTHSQYDWVMQDVINSVRSA